MSNSLKPAIRFKEFTNDWEQSRVGELFNISRGYVLGKKEIKSFKFGDFIYPVYSSQTENNGLLGYNNKYLDKDAITWTTDGANAGTVFYRKGYFYATNVCGILSEKLMKPNLFYSNSIGKITQKFVNKTNNPKLMSNVMSQIIVNYPNVNEQTKIASLLESIFTSITLHQRKLEKLKNIKNMLLEKMFADEKILKPAIRFKEFTNAWEQRRVGDIVLPYRIKNNLGLNLKSYSISNKYGFVYQNDFFKNGGKAVFANKRNSLIVEPFSFAYNPARIDVGSIGYYKNNESCLISPLYEVFKTQENINDRFILCWFKSNLFSKIITNNKEGSVRNTLYIRNILNEFVSIPNIYEQQNISRLFSSLDTLITLHQRKLEKLKNIKNMLLEKMFVNA